MKTIFSEDIGPHGGQLQKAENYNIEVKREYSHFYVYLLDSKNKTISSKNISCEIRFSLYDGTYLDLPLKPHAADGFIIDYFSSDYNYYRITFQVEGKSVIAKFENENILVKGDL